MNTHLKLLLLLIAVFVGVALNKLQFSIWALMVWCGVVAVAAYYVFWASDRP